MAAKSSEGKVLAYLAVLAVLIAVLGGLVYAKWGDLKKQLFPEKEPTMAARPEPAPPKPPARPEPAPPKPPVPESEAPKSVVDAAAEARAKALIAQGQDLVASGDFMGAQNRFGDVAGLKCAADTRALAGQLGIKASVFDNLTADIAKNPEATGKLSIIKLSSGESFEGVVDESRSTPERLWVKKKSGIGGGISRDRIVKVTEISPEEQKAALAKRLGALEAEIKPETGVDYYQIAEFGWANNLTDSAVGSLEKAYAADKGLQQSVIDNKAGRLLAKAIWRDAKNSSFWARKFCNQIIEKYPKSKHAASARELLASIDGRLEKKKAGKYQETVTITGGNSVGESKVAMKMAEGSSGKPKAEKVVVKALTTRGRAVTQAQLLKADGVFQRGLQEYQQGRPGMPNFNQHLSEAARLFDEAFDLYEQAHKLDPGNVSIESRMTDCQRYGYHARKMKTLGGF